MMWNNVLQTCNLKIVLDISYWTINIESKKCPKALEQKLDSESYIY